MRDFRGQIGTGQRVTANLLSPPVPWSPLESPGVLPSRGEIVASGGTGVPTPSCTRLPREEGPRRRPPPSSTDDRLPRNDEVPERLTVACIKAPCLPGAPCSIRSVSGAGVSASLGPILPAALLRCVTPASRIPGGMAAPSPAASTGRTGRVAGDDRGGLALYYITDHYEWVDRPLWAVAVILVGLFALAAGPGLYRRERARKRLG